MRCRSGHQNLECKDKVEMRSARRFKEIKAWIELEHGKKFQQLYIKMFVIIKTLLSSTIGAVNMGAWASRTSLLLKYSIP